MNEYFSVTKSLRTNVKVELDLSKYATKANLKNATGVDTPDFAKKTDLANSKYAAVTLDIDKLKNVPSGLKTTLVDLNKLKNVPENMLLKRLNIMNKLKITILILLILVI